MKKDFSIFIYRELLICMMQSGYSFQTFHRFNEEPEEKTIVLRHDVDARKEHSLQFAKIQHEMGIVGTYYFRMIPQSFDLQVVNEISSMGHEIGYHYEDMDFAKGDPHEAIKLFQKHLAQFREVADIKTICMHGSPLSKFDNRDLWDHYDYRDYGIIAEPYFDLDFSKVLYLTDTGRRWDGEGVSIRDKVPVAGDVELSCVPLSRNVELLRGDEPTSTVQQFNNLSNQPLSKNYSFRSTHDIINACISGKLPDQIMFNFHPQRWTDSTVLWAWELVIQNMKNVVKAGLMKFRG